MNPTVLLEKLIEIERSIGSETNTTLRNKVLEAQEYVLEMQKETVERLRRQPRSIGMTPFPSSRFAA
jgi:hypothetical protein